MDSHRRRSTHDAGASPPLPPRSQILPTSPTLQTLPRPEGMARSPADPAPTHRSPAASAPTPMSPAAPAPTSKAPPPSTSTLKPPAADLEEHKGTTELLRAIKIEKANGPDLEEHMGVGELHMEPTKIKKRKRSRQSSGEHHGEHEETNKVVMKPSTSNKKRKATLPSLGSLPINKDKQPSPGSLPVEKNKQPSLSKKVVRSPVLNNVIVSSLARREKKAKSLESSPSQPSLLALSPNVANLGSRRPRKLKSKIWNEVEAIYVDGMLAQGRCTYCNQLFPASKKSGTSHIGKHLEVCEEKAKMDGMVTKIRTDSAIDPDWKFDQGRARRALVKLIVLHELPFTFVEYPGFRSFVKTLNPWFDVVSRTTVKEDCIASYNSHKKEIQAFFSNLSSRVSLTGDMWTSNQKLGYFCITAHYIDDSWTLQNKIIKFCLLETPRMACHLLWTIYTAAIRLALHQWHAKLSNWSACRRIYSRRD